MRNMGGYLELGNIYLKTNEWVLLTEKKVLIYQ